MPAVIKLVNLSLFLVDHYYNDYPYNLFWLHLKQSALLCLFFFTLNPPHQATPFLPCTKNQLWPTKKQHKEKFPTANQSFFDKHTFKQYQRGQWIKRTWNVWTVSGHIDLINVCQARCFHGPPFVLSFTCLTYRTWPEVSCLRVDFLTIAFCCLLGNCLLHGGLLCVFIAIFREYCFNLKGVMQGQTEMLRNELTPTPLLLPPLCVSVCLSLCACPIHSYFIPFLFADLLP